MKKSPSHAAWNQLTLEQRAQLEHWLFEDRLSYDTTLERAKKELGFTGSRSSLRRFHERTGEERTVQNIIRSQQTAQAIQDSNVNTSELSDAGMKVVAQLFVHHVTTQPEKEKEWSFLAKLLLRHESDKSRAAVKREENQIRQCQLALAREKWQDQLAQRAKIEKAEQDELDMEAAEAELEKRQSANDPKGTYQFNRWSNRTRYKVFGRDIACPELWNPESPEEEEAIEAAKKLPPGTSEKERQRIARQVFRRARKRIEREDREAAEHEAADRARIQEHHAALRQAEAGKRAQEQANERRRQAEIAEVQRAHAEKQKRLEREARTEKIERLQYGNLYEAMKTRPDGRRSEIVEWEKES